jgi:hypothetical protein
VENTTLRIFVQMPQYQLVNLEKEPLSIRSAVEHQGLTDFEGVH